MLTSEQIDEFFESGCLVLRRMFSREIVDEISAAFDRLRDRAATITQTTTLEGSYFVVQGNRIDRVVWCGAAEPRLLEISARPEYLGPASQLLGSSTMEQLICQAHFKIPGDTVSFRWHQDSENRRYGTREWSDVNGKGSFVQTLLAVDPMREDNGPLVVCRGSHREGHLDLDKKENPSEFVDPDTLFPLLLEPGDLVLLHPFTIHGSSPNNSPIPRRVFINGYAYPGANSRVYPGAGACRKLHFAGA